MLPTPGPLVTPPLTGASFSSPGAQYGAQGTYSAPSPYSGGSSFQQGTPAGLPPPAQFPGPSPSTGAVTPAAPTNLEVMMKGLSLYITQNVLTPLQQAQAAEGIGNWSVERMASVLGLPASRPNGGPQPILPSSPVMSPQLPGTSRLPMNGAAVPPQGTCAWRFSRGESRGLLCGKNSEPGSIYCKSHSKSGKKKTDTPVFTGMVPPMTPPSPQAPSTMDSIRVSVYDASRGLFKDHYGLILEQHDPHSDVFVVGYENENGDILPLNPAMEELAKRRQLVIKHGAVPARRTDAPPAVAPTLPQTPPTFSTQTPPTFSTQTPPTFAPLQTSPPASQGSGIPPPASQGSGIPPPASQGSGISVPPNLAPVSLEGAPGLPSFSGILSTPTSQPEVKS